jgi:hypothetical protein
MNIVILKKPYIKIKNKLKFNVYDNIDKSDETLKRFSCIKTADNIEDFEFLIRSIVVVERLDNDEYSCSCIYSRRSVYCGHIYYFQNDGLIMPLPQSKVVGRPKKVKGLALVGGMNIIYLI